MGLEILRAEFVVSYSYISHSAGCYVTDEAYHPTCGPRHMYPVCHAGIRLFPAPQLHGCVPLPDDRVWSRGHNCIREEILQLLSRLHHVLRYVTGFALSLLVALQHSVPSCMVFLQHNLGYITPTPNHKPAEPRPTLYSTPTFFLSVPTKNLHSRQHSLPRDYGGYASHPQ